MLSPFQSVRLAKTGFAVLLGLTACEGQADKALQWTCGKDCDCPSYQLDGGCLESLADTGTPDCCARFCCDVSLQGTGQPSGEDDAESIISPEPEPQPERKKPTAKSHDDEGVEKPADDHTESVTEVVVATTTKPYRIVATSTTRTTTVYCYEDEVTWEPLDMMGGGVPFFAESAVDCQTRCQRTHGCLHFVYQTGTHLCHLQDAFASRSHVAQELGYISGPFYCREYLDMSEYVEVERNAFLPNELQCIEPGVSWAPDLAPVQLVPGTREEVLSICQRFCDEHEGCQRWTVFFPNQCHLSGLGASAMLGLAYVVSGPTSSAGCDGRHRYSGEEDYMFKMEETDVNDGAPARTLRLLLRHSGLATGSLLAMFGGVAFWLRRSKRPRSREAILTNSVDIEDLWGRAE